MTTVPAAAPKAAGHGRQKSLAAMLEDIHLRGINTAELGLHRDHELVAEFDCNGWTVMAAVTASGKKVEAGYPKITLARGETRIELHFPTLDSGDCNIIRGYRQIVVRKGVVESDNGSEREDHPQPVEHMIQSIHALIPSVPCL